MCNFFVGRGRGCPAVVVDAYHSFDWDMNSSDCNSNRNIGFDCNYCQNPVFDCFDASLSLDFALHCDIAMNLNSDNSWVESNRLNGSRFVSTDTSSDWDYEGVCNNCCIAVAFDLYSDAVDCMGSDIDHS